MRTVFNLEVQYLSYNKSCITYIKSKHDVRTLRTRVPTSPASAGPFVDSSTSNREVRDRARHTSMISGPSLGGGSTAPPTRRPWGLKLNSHSFLREESTDPVLHLSSYLCFASAFFVDGAGRMGLIDRPVMSIWHETLRDHVYRHVPELARRRLACATP
jgi:hypothetical protein